MKKLLILLPLLLAGCSTPSFVTHDIPNLRPVSGHPAVWRGGQPATFAGWSYLAATCGVSNVVKLNLESEGSDDGARQLGMTVHYYPIDSIHQWLLMPSLQTFSNAVAAITPGTYVHCTHGWDRTGETIGFLRVWVDGWTPEAAYAEMVRDSFHSDLGALWRRWQSQLHKPPLRSPKDEP